MTHEQIEIVNGMISREFNESKCRTQSAATWREMNPYRNHSRKKCRQIAKTEDHIAELCRARGTAIEVLLAERNELLEALKGILANDGGDRLFDGSELRKYREMAKRIIAKAEGSES